LRYQVVIYRFTMCFGLRRSLVCAARMWNTLVTTEEAWQQFDFTLREGLLECVPRWIQAITVDGTVH
jgi:hypothetical protein